MVRRLLDEIRDTCWTKGFDRAERALHSAVASRRAQVKAMSAWLFVGLCVVLCTLGQTKAWGETLRRIVVFQEGTPVAVQTALVAESGCSLLQALPLVNAVVINLPADRVQEALASLKSHPEVVEIHLDVPISAESLHGIKHMRRKRFPAAYPHDEVSWNLSQIRLNRVSRWVRGDDVRVALLDTGVDYTHPHLASKVVDCYNARVGEDPADCMDRNGHGTHIAGIIAGRLSDRNMAAQIAGIAQETKLVAVKVLDDAGGGFVSDLINGLSWVVGQRNIRLVNMSLGFYKEAPFPLLHKVVNILYKANVIMVAAAGNYKSTVQQNADGSLVTTLCVPDAAVASGEGGEALLTGANGDSVMVVNDPTCNGQVKFPARYPETIAVAATDIHTNIAYYSIKGDEIDIVAPGGTRQNPILSTNTTHGVPRVATVCTNGARPAAAGEGGEGIVDLVMAGEGGEGEGGECTPGVDPAMAGEGGEGIVDLVIADEGGEGEGGEGEGGEGEGGESPSGFGRGSGTSQAAAHVTGTIALMLEENRRLTPDDIRLILQFTAIDLGVPTTAQGSGLLDAARAVRWADDWWRDD